MGTSSVVKICDFGNGCFFDVLINVIQTRQYRSPEVILGIDYDTSADMWSFVCMIFELITGDYLFDPRSGDGYNKEDDHLAYVTELIGHPDKDYILSGSRSRKYYTTKGKLKRIKKHERWSLFDVLYDKYKFKKQEAK